MPKRIIDRTRHHDRAHWHVGALELQGTYRNGATEIEWRNA
jgi:hypothetical protein